MLKERWQILLGLMFGAAVVGSTLSCGGIQDLLKGVELKNPTVSFAGVELTKLSFDAADVRFDLRVENPNPIGVKLAGFDYDLLINDSSFLQGQQNQGIDLKAKGENVVQIPLSLVYADLYKTYQNLHGSDSSKYLLKCGFAFELPVLGPVRVPVSKSGSIPLLKLPVVKLEGIRVQSLGLTGADLQLALKLNNPNALSFVLGHLQYRLHINGQQWATGTTTREMAVAQKGDSIIELPISLNFLQIGQSVYQALRGGQRLNYQLQGNLGLKSSLATLGQVNLDFDQSGQVNMQR